MKIFLFLIGMVAAGVLGYSFEPQMRYMLTGKVPVADKKETRRVAVETGIPSKQAHPASYPADRLPENPAPAPLDPPAVVVVETPFEQPAETPAEPEMTPEPVAPEPEPAPEPAVPDGPVDVVAVMQDSIKGGAIKEFTFDQVLDWQPSEAPETVDGESYRTGIASYKAETVFGVKTIQAKALIKGGKVVRWLWPKSGMEIK